MKKTESMVINRITTPQSVAGRGVSITLQTKNSNQITLVDTINNYWIGWTYENV